MIKPFIDPPISGQWKPTNPISGTTLYRTLEFMPDASFLPNQNYKVKLSNVLPAIGLTYSQEIFIPFKTSNLPKVISVHPNLEEEIGACEKLSFEFDQNILNIDNAKISIVPEAKLSLSLNKKNKSVLEVKATDCFEQGKQYELVITSNVPIDENLSPKMISEKYKPFTYKKNIVTKKAPSTTLLPNQRSRIDINNLELQFSENLNQKQVLEQIRISPEITGEWNWENEKILKFKILENLKYGQEYTVSIPGRIYTDNQSYIEGLFSSFYTYGPAKVTSLTPFNNQSQVSTNPQIRVSFDQPVNQTSAQNSFKIEPYADGLFSWQGNSLVFSPSNLNQDTTYTISLSSGIDSINGLPSTQSYQSQFRTVETQTILNVPFDRQDYALSCEASALKMALGYYGLNPSEDEIMDYVGYNGPLHRDNDLNIWGNPNISYVGDIKGSQNTTGYGVHWGPIARAANNYRPSQAFSGWSASQLAAEIAKGNPVIIWGSMGGYQDSWFDESGNSIYTWKGEHTWTVFGFTGSIDNPTGFYTHNPLGPANQKWTNSAFLGNWGKFGYSGVVVR